MSMPDSRGDQRREAMSRAWTAAEFASSEADLHLWESSRTRAEIATAWAAIAAVLEETGTRVLG